MYTKFDTTKLKTASTGSYTELVNLASKNIKQVLKQKYPNTNFSVRKENYNCIRVEWVDAPFYDDVEKLLSVFDIGKCESQQDYFYTEETEFSKKYGGVEFLFLNQSFSEEFETKIFERIKKTIPLFENVYGVLVEPTIEDYHKGKFINSSFRNVLLETIKAEFLGTTTRYETSYNEVKEQVNETPVVVEKLKFDEEEIEKCIKEFYKTKIEEYVIPLRKRGGFKTKKEVFSAMNDMFMNEFENKPLPNTKTIEKEVNEILRQLQFNLT